jgi:hypothetical protein
MDIKKQQDVIIKLPKDDKKEKISKTPRKKTHYLQKNTSSEIMQSRS